VRIDLRSVPPMSREQLWETHAGLYGAHAEGYANVLQVVPPEIMEDWVEVEGADLTREEIHAPCGYCWRWTEIRRLMLRSGDRLGIFWVGQCECGTIHYALPDGPVDLTLDSGDDWQFPVS
jgi:hypothetical protein